jgi:hypothetical protein
MTQKPPPEWVRISGCLGLKAANKAWFEIGETYARMRLPYAAARAKWGSGWAIYRVPADDVSYGQRRECG